MEPGSDPPPDPTVGGFMAQIIRFGPNTSIDFSALVAGVAGLTATMAPAVAGD